MVSLQLPPSGSVLRAARAKLVEVWRVGRAEGLGAVYSGMLEDCKLNILSPHCILTILCNDRGKMNQR